MTDGEIEHACSLENRSFLLNPASMRMPISSILIRTAFPELPLPKTVIFKFIL
jgi:hypothetical protein